MRITPRKEEVSRVVAILESDGFTDADQMAKALIKEVADILAMRDWYALVHTWNSGERGLNWAPFASESEALRTAARVGIGGRYGVVKLYSPGALVANHEGKKGWPGYCQTCGHPPFTHSMAGNARGKCLLGTCDCTRLVK
ncbi:hypothetical protein GCM10010124_01970 [Pilimelia terevasa]|uniref:Uncharacterized protein n=1 Tax=Pilimelia terevasa TaxID=53372 RepID=A0A8J3BGD7_9ACTN|nr:hypothetical protein [Pilimelia terevasa]GGK13044.1 hypothetical protein GCM10010124_01970 [Pilimelia terevasa]